MTNVGLEWDADPFRTHVERRADGKLLLRPQGTLPEYPARLMDFLEHWARIAPDRVLVARRAAGREWQPVSYAAMLERAQRVAAGLARRDLSAQRPILIASGNSIEHLVLGFAAMWAGIPYCPMSPAYSLMSCDLSKARHAVELLTPGMIAAFDTPAFVRVLTQLELRDVEIVGDAPVAGRKVTTLQDLEAPVSGELETRHRSIDADTIARFLLTSGSTGQPKAVITTNRMCCSNATMLRQAMPFLAEEPPVLVDWLPWNHTFGGSHNIGLVLSSGGTLYIDDGKPTLAGIRETIRNLREISPTVYFNVPKGFEMLAQQLPQDDELRRSFYRRLRAYFFAGASLAQHTWDCCVLGFHTSFDVGKLAQLKFVQTFIWASWVDQGSGRSRLHSVPPRGRFPSRSWKGVDSVSSLPGGIGGVLGSDSYFNLLPGWLVNGTYRQFFETEEIKDHTTSTVRFVPPARD